MKSKNIAVEEFMSSYSYRVTGDDRESIKKYETMEDLLRGFSNGYEKSKSLFQVIVFHWLDDDWDDLSVEILRQWDSETDGKYETVLADYKKWQDTGDEDPYDRVSAWVNDHEEEGEEALENWDDGHEEDDLFVCVFQLVSGYDGQDLLEWLLENRGDPKELATFLLS